MPTPGGPSLLAVFAHPDDESLACGGLLALCAGQGVGVSLLCLTRGELGGDPDARERELDAAARALGVGDVVLLDHEDGMLSWIEPARVEADIASAIARFRPDVVVTFDEDGLYWHPDHIAVHERTTAAVSGLGAAAPALRYVSMPAGAMRALVEAAGGRARRPGILGVEDVDAFGAGAPPPSLVVDAGACAVRKLAALRCHRTQVEGSALDLLDERDAARLLGTEHYREAAVGAPGESFLERFGVPAGARSE